MNVGYVDAISVVLFSVIATLFTEGSGGRVSMGEREERKRQHLGCLNGRISNFV